MPSLNRWGMVVDPDRPHLGGYFPDGDPASHCPDLWDWLIVQGVGSVLDIGCGSGEALRYFRGRGCLVAGVDGIAQEDEWIVEHDYTTGPLEPSLLPRQEFDLVWSCEFVEHVEERYVENFLPSFGLGSMLLMTHGMPGQGGHHHVNCQPPDYWIEKVHEAGLRHDEELTRRTRLLAPRGYYARSGLVFTR